MIQRAVLLLAASAVLIASTSALAQPTQGGPLPTPLPLFPGSNWWNLDISNAPPDPSSAAYINHINANGTVHLHPDFGGEESPGSQFIYGMPYVVVDGTQPKVAVKFQYWDESDGVDPASATHEGVPFYPIPEQAKTQPHWIEGGEPGNVPPSGDRHMLIVDRTNNLLYELYRLHWNGTKWTAGSGAFFDMKTNNRRPEGWTSADAAGLAILPGLLRYDEVYTQSAEIGHALRMTVRDSNGYVYPGSHDAGDQAGALPMGARLRLKAGTAIGGQPAAVQKIFQAMKKYGLIVADNGTDMYIGGTFDTRWDNDVLNPAFDALTASDFEVVQLGYRATPTATAPPRTTPTATATAPTATATARPTLTQTATASSTATVRPRASSTATATSTTGATATATRTASATATRTATATATATRTATATAAATATATTAPAASFYTLAPCRAHDTRGASAPALQGGLSRTFPLAGQCGIPSTARAVSVNVTITGPSTAGDLRMYPAGAALPVVSVINYGPGTTRANNAIVTLGAGGGIAVHCDQGPGATVQLILDVNGYFQ